jgi:hypothetical protein
VSCFSNISAADEHQRDLVIVAFEDLLRVGGKPEPNQIARKRGECVTREGSRELRVMYQEREQRFLGDMVFGVIFQTNPSCGPGVISA